MSSKEIVLGRVRQKNQGEYNESKEYILLDRVTYNDTIYECIKQATNILPTNSAYWVTVSRQGKPGRAPSYNIDDNGFMFIECPDQSTSCGTGVCIKGEDGISSDIELTDSIDYNGTETKGASSKAVSTVASYSGPVGFITMFYGEFGGTDNRYPIPIGSTTPDTRWVICDGVETNGIKVPDLRGRTTIQSDDQTVYGGFADYNHDALTQSTPSEYTGEYPYLFVDTLEDNKLPYVSYYINNYSSQNGEIQQHLACNQLGAKNTDSTLLDLVSEFHDHRYGNMQVSSATFGMAVHRHKIEFWPVWMPPFTAEGSDVDWLCGFETSSSTTYSGYYYYGSNDTHTHTLTGTVKVTNNGSDIPPYIALAYIMKIA